MDTSALAKSPYAINLEVVDDECRAVQHRPINVEDFLRSENRTVDVGNGVTLHLEDYDPNALYPDEDGDGHTYEFYRDGTGATVNADDDGNDDAVSSGSTPFARRGEPISSPPGTSAGDWYDVLNALRREREDVAQETSALGERHPSFVAGGPEGAVTGAQQRSARGTVSTPLERFAVSASSATPSRANKSMAPPASGKVVATDGRSRREVWSSFATPTDSTRNYRRLQYVSVLAEKDPRHFRPSALAFHSMASYLHAKDRCQRVLVYGGLSQVGKGVEKELYEFSFLTGCWRRLEGHQFVPAGHYGHAMVVVEAVDRLVVIGGVGLGGLRAPARNTRRASHKNGRANADTKDTDDDDMLAAQREDLLFPLLQSQSRLQSTRPEGESRSGAPVSALSTRTALNTTIGFVPFLFDMDLTTQRWRAVEPAAPFPLAFHTAVAFGREVFVFGGITETMAVSGQLLAINVETFAVRLIAGTTAYAAAENRHGPQDAHTDDRSSEASPPSAPPARYLHSAVRYGNYMVVFGGLDHRNVPLNDLWAFDCVNERWERLACRGTLHPRWGHAASVAGNRLIIAGGFECDLDESPRQQPAESGGQAGPAASVMEVNLIPTANEEYLCRESLAIHPPLPPLAFSTAAPCGDDSSLIVFGGLTKLPRRKTRKSSAAGRRRRAARSDYNDEGSHGDGDSDNGDDSNSDVERAGEAAKSEAKTATKNYLITRYPVFADALVATFSVKAVKRADDTDGDTYVNELGIEVSKSEMPESFKTFVRRQNDFLKKKAAAAAEAMHRTTMEEKEAMEPTLYLTEDEIERLIERSEECCTAFSEAYKMDALPSNVPERDERIHITEECVSLSRQVRDVMKSMKASKVGVTAVKSKDHRHRAGQKFEDYSAAKPFRRIVVADLLEGIQTQLHHMHRLNRGLHTVVWEEKQAFLDAIKVMQDSVDTINKTIGGIVNKYISHRVKSLMKGVDKHKEVMRLLTEVVERNRRDKIFNKDQQVDKQRERVKRAWANAEAEETHKDGNAKKSRQPSASPAGRLRRSRTTSASRRHLLGAGYYKEESTASITLADAEWERLRGYATKVERCAARLHTCCQHGIATTPAAMATAPSAQEYVGAQAGTPTPTSVGAVPLSVPLQVATAVATITPPMPSVLPPPAGPVTATTPQPTTSPAGAPLPTPALPGTLLQTTLSPPATASGVLSVPTLPGAPPLTTAAVPPSLTVEAGVPPAPSTAAQSPAVEVTPEVGALSNAAIVVRHSNELRHKIAATAQAVGEAASAFCTALSDTAPPLSVKATSPAPAATPSPAGLHTLPLPAVAPLPKAVTPTTATATTTAATTSGDQTQSPPPSTSATTAAAKAATPPLPSQAVDVTHGTKRVLYLAALRPLLEAREELAAAVAAAPAVRLNVWDSNNLAGAPQDENVEKLCRRLQQLLTALVQHISGSFLSASGARKPRKRVVQLSTVQHVHLTQATGSRPPRGPSGTRAAASGAGKSSHRDEKRSKRSSSGPSAGAHRRTAGTTTTATTSDTSSSSSSSSASSSSSSSRSTSSSSAPSTRDASGKAQNPAYRHVEALSAGRDSASTRSDPQGLPLPIEGGAVVVTARKDSACSTAPSRLPPGRIVAALQPLYTGPKSHLVQLATLDGSDPATAATQMSTSRSSVDPSQGRQCDSVGSQRRAGNAGALLPAQRTVPLVPYTPDLIAMPRDPTATVNAVPAADGTSSAFDTAAVLEPSHTSSTRVVPNIPTAHVTGTAALPLSGTDANARNVFLEAGGARPRFANDWALMPPTASTAGVAAAYGERRSSISSLPGTRDMMDGTATAARTGLHGSSSPQDGSATVGASFTRGAGPVMHAPVTRASSEEAAASSASAAAAASPARRSTISMLAQLHPEPVYATSSGASLEPATSVSPGTFVVSTDYYAQTHSQPVPAAGTADAQPGQLSGRAATATGDVSDSQHWADVDEDYFYFGQGVHKGTPADMTPFSDVTNLAAQRNAGKRVLAAGVTTSPPIGTVLGSQRVNASYVPAGGQPRRGAAGADSRHPSTGRCAPVRASVTQPTESSRRRGHSASARPSSATTRAQQTVVERGQQTAMAGGSAVNVASSGPFRGRLTPGERQILEARERLRRH